MCDGFFVSTADFPCSQLRFARLALHPVDFGGPLPFVFGNLSVHMLLNVLFVVHKMPRSSRAFFSAYSTYVDTEY